MCVRCSAPLSDIAYELGAECRDPAATSLCRASARRPTSLELFKRMAGIEMTHVTLESALQRPQRPEVV